VCVRRYFQAAALTQVRPVAQCRVGFGQWRRRSSILLSTRLSRLSIWRAKRVACSSRKFRFRNDLYCVGWGVKLYCRRVSRSSKPLCCSPCVQFLSIKWSFSKLAVVSFLMWTLGSKSGYPVILAYSTPYNCRVGHRFIFADPIQSSLSINLWINPIRIQSGCSRLTSQSNP